MLHNSFLTCVEELVEAPAGSLNMSTPLNQIAGFDSMTVLGLISWADSKGISLAIEDFEGIKNLGEIYKLLRGK